MARRLILPDVPRGMLRIPEGPPRLAKPLQRPPLIGFVALAWLLFSAGVFSLSSGWIALPELSSAALASELTKPRVASVATRSEAAARYAANRPEATRRPASDGRPALAPAATPPLSQAEAPRSQVFRSGIYDRSRNLDMLYEPTLSPSGSDPSYEPSATLSSAASAPAPQAAPFGPSESELEARELRAFERASRRPGAPPAARPEPPADRSGAVPQPAPPAVQARAQQPATPPRPSPAGPVASGKSCEAAISASSDSMTFGGRHRAQPDLTREQYGAVLNDGSYLSHCGVAPSTSIQICVAVQHGRAQGVSVTLRPDHVAQRACVDAAVRRLSFPSHPKLDVVRTTFGASR